MGFSFSVTSVVAFEDDNTTETGWRGLLCGLWSSTMQSSLSGCSRRWAQMRESCWLKLQWRASPRFLLFQHLSVSLLHSHLSSVIIRYLQWSPWTITLLLKEIVGKVFVTKDIDFLVGIGCEDGKYFCCELEQDGWQREGGFVFFVGMKYPPGTPETAPWTNDGPAASVSGTPATATPLTTQVGPQRSAFIGSCKYQIWEAIRASSAAPYYLDDFSSGKSFSVSITRFSVNPKTL